MQALLLQCANCKTSFSIVPESASGRRFLIKRSIYNPWTLAFSYQFIFEISCCFLKMIRFLIEKLYTFTCTLWGTKKLFSNSKTFVNLGSFLIDPLFRHFCDSPADIPVFLNEPDFEGDWRQFVSSIFSLLIWDLFSEVSPKFQNTINSSFNS